MMSTAIRILIASAGIAFLMFPPSVLFSQTDEELDRAAEDHFRNRDYPRAVETWKKILDRNPGDTAVKGKLERTYQVQYAAELAAQQERLKKLQQGSSADKKPIMKELEIRWDAVDGAVKYQVQVMDARDTMMLDRIVDTNVLRFTFPEGAYRMRVGAINIFDRVGAWSDWSELKVMRRESPEALRVRGIIDHGFTFSAGLTYLRVLSEMGDLYEDSYNGWTVLAGYRLKSIAALSRKFLARNLGIEVELSNISFAGKSFPLMTDNRLEIFAGGINVKLITDFSLPVNFALRAGAGIANSVQDYKVLHGGGVLYDSFRKSSTDPYYKAGASIVLDFFSFFLEGGADYYMVDYLGNDLSGIRGFVLAGLKI